MFRESFFIQCDKCSKFYRMGEEGKKHIIPNSEEKVGDMIHTPFRGNLNNVAAFDGWLILEPDGHLCPECRKGVEECKIV